MIFQHTLSKVLDGTKTRTSRIQKPGDSGYLLIEPKLVIRNGRLVYRQHSVLAVQPQRGKRGVAHIKLLDIGDYDVRDITPEQVKAEGFGSVTEFWLVWCAMHDKGLDLQWNQHILDYTYRLKAMWRDACSQQQIPEVLANRPTERYTAWALDFKLET